MSEPASIRIGVDLGTRHAALVVQPPLGPLASALVELPEPCASDGPEETARRLAQVVEAGLRLLGEGSTAPRELTLVSSGPGRVIGRGDGGKLALLLTEGFTDLLRPELGQLASEPALTRGLRCLAVPERVGADGQIVRALTAGDAASLREQVRELGASAVAVALLHSSREPRHEAVLGQALAGLGLPVALSSELLPQPGELLRASAAVLDAHAAPTFHAEAAALRGGLGAKRLRSVLSDGTARVEARPVRAVHNEAVAALLGVQRVAAAHELTRWIGLGIGAELATAAVHDGGFERSPQAELGGLPLALPGLALTVRRIGAEVPLSPEGALPVGTSGPSLLDAARALSRLSEDAGRPGASGPASGERLDPARAEQLWEAAVTEAAATVREASVERGHDPGDHTLICHGGAGPLLGPSVAERLGITRVLIPPVPGHMGALGALCAQCARERVRYLWTEASGAQQGGQLESTVRSLSEEMQRDLRAEGMTSSPPGAGLFWAADLRYQGQAHELTLHGIGEGGPAQDGTTDLVVRFHQEHRRRYGFTIGERPIELVAVRVRCAMPVAAPAASALIGLYGALPAPAGPPESSDMMMRAVASFGAEGGDDAQAAALVLQRQQLQPGETLGGPLLIVEPGASTYVPPGWRVTPSELGALWLQA